MRRARLRRVVKANALLWAYGLLLGLQACSSQTAISRAASMSPAVPTNTSASAPPATSSGFTRTKSEAEMHTAGEQLYLQRCSMCHDAGRAPPRSQIATLSPKEIFEALDTGFMAAISQFMTPEEKKVLIWHLSGKHVP